MSSFLSNSNNLFRTSKQWFEFGIFVTKVPNCFQYVGNLEMKLTLIKKKISLPTEKEMTIFFTISKS